MDTIQRICEELCEAADGGRPGHPRLVADVKRALWIAEYSQVFREVVARSTTNTQPENGP